MATVGRGDGGEKVKRGGSGVRAQAGRGSYGAARRGETRRGEEELPRAAFAHSTASPSDDNVAQRERRSRDRPDAHEAFYEWTEAIIEASD